MDLHDLRTAYNAAVTNMRTAADAIDALGTDADAEAIAAAERAFDLTVDDVEAHKQTLDRAEARAAARESHPPVTVDEHEPIPVAPRVIREAYTYYPGVDHSFFRDLGMMQRGDEGAIGRLQRHRAETRDLGSALGSGGDFLPPVYLAEMFVFTARAGRPFADLIQKAPMFPVGNSVDIPALSTGTSTNYQDDNTAVSETDATTSTITHSVATIAGQQDMSRQVFERTLPGMDQIIFADLVSSYDTKLDSELIIGSGAAGRHMGIRNVVGGNAVTYTDTTPTAAELVPKVYDAIQRVESNRHKPADLLLMHPRRSAWMASNLSASFPLFQLGSLMQAAGTQDGGMLRSFSGLRNVIDANVPTNLGAGVNEDEIYTLHSGDMWLLEDALRTAVYWETLSGTLTARLQVFAYSLFISKRYPKAIGIISGTGLTPPTF